MPLKQHEVLDLQEHIRGTAASAQVYSQFAQVATDPDIRSFCQQEAQQAQQTVTKLMGLLQQGQTH